MFFDRFPYLNYSDINLDWLVQKMMEFTREFHQLAADVDAFKKYVDDYLENIDVSDDVREILDEWYESGDLQDMLLEYNSKHLTSNDIDVQALYSYVVPDGRALGETSYYPVYQSMVITEGGNFITISHDERTLSNQGMIREYNANGISTGRTALVEVGHANGATYREGKVYIAWGYEYDGTSSDEITVFDVQSFTLDHIEHIGHECSSIAYDPDDDAFILAGFQSGNSIYVFTMDPLFQGITRARNFIKESWMNLNQDIFYYDGMICFIGAFPNSLVFFDKITAEIRKIYNPAQRAGIGLPFNEMESGYFYNGDFYITAFARLDNYTSYNLIAKINPWKNVYDGYKKENRYSGQLGIYVDGDQTEPFQDGSQDHPFKHIGQALAVWQSKTHVTTPLSIACKVNTEVGMLSAFEAADLKVDVYGGTGKYTLYGLRLERCANVRIANANIKYNANGSTGYAAAYLSATTGTFDSLVFDPSGDEVSGSTNTALFAGYGSRINIYDPVIPSDFARGLQLNQQSYAYVSGGSNEAASKYLCYADSWVDSPAPEKSLNTFWTRRSRSIICAHVFSGTAQVPGDFNLNYDTNITNFQGFNFAMIQVQHGNGYSTFTAKLPASGTSVPIDLTGGHMFGNLWMFNMILTIDLATKKMTLTENLSYNTHTDVVYKRSEGATSGVSYAAIKNIYLF